MADGMPLQVVGWVLILVAFMVAAPLRKEQSWRLLWGAAALLAWAGMGVWCVR